MKAIVTQNHGNFDVLSNEFVSIPRLNSNEVLVKVLAASINNTDINLRIGWYNSNEKDGTNDAATIHDNGGWKGTTKFPMIQGTDCCGIVVDIGENDALSLLNKRVLIRPCQRINNNFSSYDSIWMGSDCDGSFAEYVKVPVTEVFVVESEWSDEELACIPCVFGTSENMMLHIDPKPKSTILITGASGGVGSACVQLAKLRNCYVIGITSSVDIRKTLEEIGCDEIYLTSSNLLQEIGENKVDIIMDNVGGKMFPILLKLLKIGGKYISSGAISGAIVNLDLRDLYLKDIQIIGTTCWEEQVFPNIISYIENNRIKPIVYKTFFLKDIVEAQKEFMKKKHIGKIVLVVKNDYNEK